MNHPTVGYPAHLGQALDSVLADNGQRVRRRLRLSDVVTAVDLKHGAEPDWKHRLAAVYIGFTVALGHRTIKWVDARVAHRFAGGPAPVRARQYGAARAVHEWKVAGRWMLAAGIAMGLLQAAIWYVGGDREVGSLRMWQQKMLLVIGINAIIAGTYTVFPRREPVG